MIELTVRIAFSLAVVLFLMWLLAKVARRPLAGRPGGALSVLARQQLTRNASVVVVSLGDRALVVGVTEQQVTLLAEADPAAVEAPARAGGEVREPLSLADLTLPDGSTPVAVKEPAPAAVPALVGGLAGSALSPATWRQAATALRRGRRP